MDNPPPPLHAGFGGAAESVQLSSTRSEKVRAVHQHRGNVRHRRRRQVCDVIMIVWYTYTEAKLKVTWFE